MKIKFNSNHYKCKIKDQKDFIISNKKGEDLVLNRNMFVEDVLPSAIIRKLTDEEMKQISEIQKELTQFMENRDVNKERDLEFFKKMVRSNIK